VGALTLTLLVILALFPGVCAPYDPTERVGRPLQPPGEAHLLGTNDIGQDIFSELIWATRVSLFTGLVVGFVTVTLGTLVGLVSGYTSGFASALLMRLADLTLVLPFLPLVILLSAYLGPSQRNVILILSLVFWPSPARLVRSRVLTLAGEGYVEAARALGAGRWQILRRHVWPGVRSLVVTQFVLFVSAAILAEASLSFLGLGEPTTKSWGSMLYFARVSGAFLGRAWRWWVLPAGLMITLTVLSLVLVGYALEEGVAPPSRPSGGGDVSGG
jgi:ABC-type dipeptide/oligopeptide/nickel transport system permease subunit